MGMEQATPTQEVSREQRNPEAPEARGVPWEVRPGSSPRPSDHPGAGSNAEDGDGSVHPGSDADIDTGARAPEGSTRPGAGGGDNAPRGTSDQPSSGDPDHVGALPSAKDTGNGEGSDPVNNPKVEPKDQQDAADAAEKHPNGQGK